jgi:hypothetical protein
MGRRPPGRFDGVAIRFWRKVALAGPDECWLWRGARRGRSAYGGIRVNGRMEQAHRVSWELTYGPIPGLLLVLHACDTPLCQNPRHLFLGTTLVNSADCRLKGREAAGERHGQAKLTGEQVVAIRELAADGLPTRVLARTFAIAQDTVMAIIRGTRWRRFRAAS